MVGPPKVINKKVNDQLLEPFEVMSSGLYIPIISFEHKNNNNYNIIIVIIKDVRVVGKIIDIVWPGKDKWEYINLTI